ncbi:5754_t:CDS:10, partial [Racocetra fulgida]
AGLTPQEADFAAYLYNNGHREPKDLDKNSLEKLRKDYVGYLKAKSYNLQSELDLEELREEYYDKKGELDLGDFTYSDENYPPEGTCHLDLSDFIDLKELKCYQNKLTSLKLINCQKLEKIDCFGNQLTSLDVSNCSNLIEILCFYNKLANITLPPNLTNLKKIDLKYNNLPNQKLINQCDLYDKDMIVVLKSLTNSQSITLEFLTEVTNTKLFDSDNNNIVKCHGISQDPQGNYVMGLRDIHDQNLVHRDFHSGNILNDSYVSDNKFYSPPSYITDFGLSRPANFKKQEGQIFGVLPYVAPEVLQGGKYTQAADVYSWGIIAYELFANEYPYPEVDDLELALKVYADPAKRPKRSPPFYQQYQALEEEYNTFSQNTPYQIHPNAITTSKMIDTREITQRLQSLKISEIGSKEIKYNLEDNIEIDNADKKKVTITLGTSTGLGGNAKFQTEGTGAPLTGKTDDGTTDGTAATGGRTNDTQMAASGIATIEVNCSTELEARKVIGLLDLKELGQHYTKDGGDLASRNLDSDLAALEKYSKAAADTNEQVVYGVDDVLRANANQFIIALRHNATAAGGAGNANLIWEDGTNDETNGEISKIFDETDGIKKNPAGVPTYKGFPIFEDKQKPGKNNTNNNQNKNRREFGEDADGSNGKNAAASSIFTKTNIDDFRLTAEFDGESDPQNCRGFQPGDLTTANNFRLRVVSGFTTTNIDIDISATGKKDDKKPIDAVGLLEKYYIALKVNNTIDYANNEDNQKIVDASYNIMLQIAQLVDENPTDQASYEKWVEKFENLFAENTIEVIARGGSGPSDPEETAKLMASVFWPSRFLDLKRQKKPTQTPPPTGKKPDDAKIDAARDEIVGAATGGNDMKALLKKIFDDNRAELKKNDEAVLTNLKELAKIIDRAYKNGAEVRPSELRAYSGGDVNQKKAWELANKVVDKDNKKLADEALIKAKKPEKTLDEIKQEAKAAIIENNNVLNSETLVNKVVEIFGKCKSAWAKNKGTDANLVSELEGYKREINKYKFDDKGNACAEGYATGALAKLKKATTDLTTLITESKIDQVTDQASLDKALGIIKGSANYNNIKTDVEQLVEPRAKLLVELNKDSNADKKALAKLIAEFIKKFEKNYVDSNYATDLSTLENKLTELKKYSETGDKNTVYKNLSAEGKATLNKLISGLDAKVKAMQAAKKASEQSQSPDGFVDIETPILAQSSPEGARCFVVPSNLPNRYYTLPQSPQIFKQLLMMSGFDKHYQIDKSFRNEDARSNRQIEFSQLDLELSFASEREIKKLVEKLLQIVLKKVFGYQITTPFPTLTYQQVIKKYGTDKPDLRQNPQKDQALNFLHPFTIPKKKYIEPLLNDKIKPEKVIGEAFDLICNGEELLSGSIRIYQRDLQEKVLQILGYKQEEREKNFGYFLRALEFAAPPHGGIGLGIDRLLAVILNTNNLKELIAFPKNIDGTCSLTGTPDFREKLYIFLILVAFDELEKKVIQPNLREKKIVVIDRYIDSTLVYQGLAGGLEIGTIQEVAKKTIDLPWPDITFVLDIDPLNLEFHHRIRNHYRELKKLFPERIHIINADQSETEILTEVQGIIKQTRAPKNEAHLPQSVRVIIQNEKGEFLLPGETPEAAACREVFEETNLTIENCQKIAEENTEKILGIRFVDSNSTSPEAKGHQPYQFYLEKIRKFEKYAGNQGNPEKTKKGKNTLLIIAGGSGTGKTTVENLLAQDPNIVKLISTTTRPPREGEKDGQDYYFISKETFQTELEKGRFLEHVIYDGNYYGIHGKVVDLILGTQNKHGVIIVDVAGFWQIKKYCTSEPEILRRLIIAEREEKFAAEFDHILTIKENDLATAAQKIKEHLKTVIFYLLTTLSCFSSFLIANNSFKAVYETLKKGGKATYQLKKTVRKLFRLQNPRRKEKSLAVLTQNIRIFTTYVVGNTMLGLGIGFFLLCTAIIIIFQYLHYKKDLEFQKVLEKETEKEKFLVNHRDLIIKKSLVAEHEKNYLRSLEKSHTAENKRDWIFTNSFVIPAYSLPKFAPFLFLRFIHNEPTFRTANSLVSLAEDTKKMAERLRFYPFGLSAQKQINDFLAEPERDDTQKNVLVSEPVESITFQKLKDLDLLLTTSENKEIFIFDEADNALDEKNKKEFRQKIEKISKKKLAEKILEDIEAQLRKLISEKKELKKKFLDKLKDLSRQEKENKVEILQLERKMTSGVLPTEREEIMKEIQKLNAYNITLEQGFKKRKIDADVVTEIRKRLGIWEEKEN